jgi:hypothetical protein
METNNWTPHRVIGQASDHTFILTAELDAESFAWLDGLRRRCFPPERNVLSAHLTMFHGLSPGHVERLCATALPLQPIAITFDAVTFFGFGNAIRANSVELKLLRQTLKEAIGDELSRQDGQRWSPHVTIQNKVAPQAARSLFQALEAEFSPRDGYASGLLVWEYLGGPGRLAHRLSFAPQ